MRKWIIGLVSAVSIVAISMGLLMFTGAPASTSTTLSTSTPGSLSEGIQVHGDWVIKVTNPNGTLAERSEFSNDLTGQGRYLLTRIMVGNTIQKDVTNWHWSVTAGGSVVENYKVVDNICGEPDAAKQCHFSEKNPTTAVQEYWHSQSGLVVQASAELPEFKLITPTFTATHNGTVGRVGTAFHTNTPNLVYPPLSHLTHTLLANPVSVEAGQLVTIEVTISFS